MSFHPSSSSSCMANRNPIVTVLLQKPILVVWLVTWAVFSEAMIVSKEEYLELKRHLKFLNKPAVKSIKIDYGDIFDCVDINKQLSFDHPALKNHTIQWAEDNTEDGTFYGTKVAINLWEPIVPNNSEFSLAQFWLTSGPYEHLNSIEAGWSVYPRLFLDNHVRLFALWTADGYRSGCFNLNCPGFVQVSEKVPLGKRLTPASAYGGEQYEIRLLAFLDPVSKNWWLVYGDEILGYWPHTLFNSLSTKADRVQWGGEVFNPNEGIDQDMPPMCSGHFPEEGYGKACFMRKMQIVKEGNILVDAPKTSTYADVSSCYNAIDKGRLDDWGRTFFFGGPGGKCIK
ncbi:protein neprosin-like isoform X2 [Aristolochia californica]|uniref:protein neprosin-like isoform X2 n=1 Tax=Aristolochia californica TaxID=171875 RepID=UPI0035D5E463